ncbi:SMI1/KNR4 family protein [Actinoplanes sp. NPDC024001]|uniref:SMI1/KNR4 family protein n=1 Tax=Actinoplanes sp. NPDC024001 TaxID=3154598 RepID=UPI00340BDBAC
MSIQQLLALAPAPGQGVDVAHPRDFPALEAELGLTLPADFKELLVSYGTGRFLDYLLPYPVAGSGMTLRLNTLLLEGHEFSRAMFPEWYPYPIYPEAGGLLLWGGTQHGHNLCWLTEGEPDEWPVIVWQPDDNEYHRYDGNAVAFLTDWLRGALPQALPSPAPGAAVWFEPARDLAELHVFLDGGAGDFAERAESLRRRFGTVQSRGSTAHGEHYEDRFATTQSWRVTYSQSPQERRVRIAFPAGEQDAARAAVLAAVSGVGHRVRHIETGRSA